MDQGDPVSTKELEELMAAASWECSAPRGCDHCEAAFELELHTKELAQEVLAQREQLEQARKALEALRNEHDWMTWRYHAAMFHDKEEWGAEDWRECRETWCKGGWQMSQDTCKALATLKGEPHD